MIHTVVTVLCATTLVAAKCAALAALVSALDRGIAAVTPVSSPVRRVFAALTFTIYPAYVIASWAGAIFAVLFVNWWAVLLADEDGNLPRWLSWFQTFDASIDAGWKDGYFPYEWGASPSWRYVARVRWLLRNPGYGIDYSLFGLTFDPACWRVLVNIERYDLVLFFSIGNGWNLYYEGRFGQAKLGWKAWNYWQGNAWRDMPWGPAWRVPVCATYNPFKRRVPSAT
ncbi:DUF7338 family protein [Pandoraea apista]|uniref:DUF7338 family protein n=1 Tax=Pandoraea apista TaxID=93218 RepID=UPI000F65FC36|nr:hypothetical protein [Pandoraea apista]RRW94284.1 hypothetical protein EGJ54_18265 [Pandoraea apista]RRX00642.1 hypothetical protein EGJ56_18910 [Pandoraea apista]